MLKKVIKMEKVEKRNKKIKKGGEKVKLSDTFFENTCFIYEEEEKKYLHTYY